MILAIDIGNTNIVLGCVDDKKTYFIERLSTIKTKMELEYAIDIKMVLDIHGIKPEKLEGAIISSVVPQITYVVKEAAEKILKDKECGKVFRIKGFLKREDGSWMELNITHDQMSVEPIPKGQEVIIVIGEKLNQEKINQCLEK